MVQAFVPLLLAAGVPPSVTSSFSFFSFSDGWDISATGVFASTDCVGASLNLSLPLGAQSVSISGYKHSGGGLAHLCVDCDQPGFLATNCSSHLTDPSDAINATVLCSIPVLDPTVQHIVTVINLPDSQYGSQSTLLLDNVVAVVDQASVPPWTPPTTLPWPTVTSSISSSTPVDYSTITITAPQSAWASIPSTYIYSSEYSQITTSPPAVSLPSGPPESDTSQGLSGQTIAAIVIIIVFGLFAIALGAVVVWVTRARRFANAARRMTSGRLGALTPSRSPGESGEFLAPRGATPIVPMRSASPVTQLLANETGRRSSSPRPLTPVGRQTTFSLPSTPAREPTRDSARTNPSAAGTVHSRLSSSVLPPFRADDPPSPTSVYSDATGTGESVLLSPNLYASRRRSAGNMV
ncbi:hypothetical protein OF83DRAFT_399104 [Amylostereum chailletii]|nr:hypothetical protein OF83DRAFT_399104 [Amylostereum chailletii]